MKPKPCLAALCGLFLASAPALPAQEEKPAPPAPEAAPKPDAPARASRPDAPPSRDERGRPLEGRSAPKPRERGADRGPERGPERGRLAEPDRERAPEPPRGQKPPEGKKVPFIGVLTAPLSPETRAHLRLPEGFGLRVVEVLRGSPAMAASLQENDILVKFEDQRLASMEQLQALVREKKKGDRVSLTVISSGAQKEVSLEIGETTVPTRPEGEGRGPRTLVPHPGEGRFTPPGHRGPDSPRGDHQEGMDLRRQVEEWREKFEQQQKAWREWQERLREWSREHGRHFPPLPGLGRDGVSYSEKREQHSASRSEAASITRSDDSGVYTLRKYGDRHIFTAHPKDGEARSWNLDREEDRRSIPEPMRDKLRLLEEIRRHHHGAGERGQSEKEGIQLPNDRRMNESDRLRGRD